MPQAKSNGEKPKAQQGTLLTFPFGDGGWVKIFNPSEKSPGYDNTIRFGFKAVVDHSTDAQIRSSLKGREDALVKPERKPRQAPAAK